MKLIFYIIALLAFVNANVALAEENAIKRSEISVSLPNVNMLRQDGKKIRFADEINDGRIVVLSFIYTSCSAICPMTSQTVARLQKKLGAEIANVHLVSVSIDAEQDTAKRLADYAEKYQAGKSWQHYTGTEEASVAIQKALTAYRGDKMNHAPVFFIKPSKSNVWLRLDGFVSADDLLREVRNL